MTGNQLPAVAYDRIWRIVEDNDLREWKASYRNGVLAVVGKNRRNVTFRHSLYASNGYAERTLSISTRLSPRRRRREARRMYRDGLTQVQIAERLGCSQKTISVDLR
jgi:DNA-binding NarL/FixJ family response regulator